MKKLTIGLFLAAMLFLVAGNAHAEDLTYPVVVRIHNGGTLTTGLEPYHILDGVGDGIRLVEEYYLDEFDDDSINTTYWSTDTAVGGTATESGTTLVLDTSGGDTDGALLIAKNTIDRTKVFHYTVRAKKATNTKNSFIVRIVRKTGEPTVASAGDFIFGVIFQDDGTFFIYGKDLGGGWLSWTGTEWTLPSTTFGTYSANTYYEVHTIADGTYWYMEIRDANGALLHTTVDVPRPWADTYAPAGDDDWFQTSGLPNTSWREVITVDSIRHDGEDYFDTSPASTRTCTELGAGTLTMSTARLIVFKDGVVQAATSTDVKCQYATACDGALNGSWLTMENFRLESDITSGEVEVTCQYNSDGTYQMASKYKMEIDFTPTGGVGGNTYPKWRVVNQ